MKIYLMALALLPLMTLADTETVGGIVWTYTVNKGEAQVGLGTWSGFAIPTETSGAIVIPSTLGGYPVTSIGYAAFRSCKQLTSVEIPSSVTAIGDNAFYSCPALTSITIPKSVTSIGDNAFNLTPFYTNKDNGMMVLGSVLYKYKCIGICPSEATVPDGVTNIAIRAFQGCIGLTSVTIPASVTSIDNTAFYECADLRSVRYLGDAPKVGLLIYFNSDSVVSYVTAGTKGWDGDPESTNVPESWPVNDEEYARPIVMLNASITHAVTFDLGNHGTRVGGGETEQSVSDGSAAVAPEVRPDDGWVFLGWDLDFAFVTGDLTVWAKYRREGALDPGHHTVTNNGYVLSFTVADDGAVIERGTGEWRAAVEPSPVGAFAIPSELGGWTVTGIGYGAFVNCRQMTSVTVPPSVTSVGDYAFGECTALRSVRYQGDAPTVGSQIYYDANGVVSYALSRTKGWNGGTESAEAPESWPVGDESARPIVILDSSITHTVTFDLGEHGTRAGGGETEQSVSVGSDAVAPEVRPDDGWFFLGWDANYAFVTNDLTVNAKYRREGALEPGHHTVTNNGYVLSFTVTDDGAVIERGAGERRAAVEPAPVGAFEIPDELGGWPVTRIGEGAFASCDQMTAVTIPPSVASIGNDAFASCSSLEIVFVPDEPQECVLQHFEGRVRCQKIGDPIDYEWLYSVKDGEVAVTGVRPAFGDVAIPSLIDGHPVTRIAENAFDNRSALTAMTIPESVKSIGVSAFSGCGGLASVTIPDGVTFVGSRAFANCRALMSVALPEGVTNIATRTFANCSALKSVSLPMSLRRIGDEAFSGCVELMTVTLPPELTRIGKEAFSGCGKIASLSIPSSVTHIGENAFSGCTGLGDGIVIADGCVLTVNGEHDADVALPVGTRLIADGAFAGDEFLATIEIPTGVTRIGDSTFANCAGLTAVGIPSGMTRIGNAAFSGCQKLASLSIPTSVTHIGAEAFSGCGALASVTIPDGVTRIGNGTFENCAALASLLIPSNVTGIGENAFSGCTGLGDGVVIADGCVLTVNGGHEPDVILPVGTRLIADGAFRTNDLIRTVEIPSSVASVADGTFAGCTGLVSAVISEGVTCIGSRAFENCRALESVKIPSSVTRIGIDAFAGCTGLGSGVVIVDKCVLTVNGGHEPNVTILYGTRLIADGAFAGDDYLQSVDIPETVVSVGKMAFSGCRGLAEENDGLVVVRDVLYAYCGQDTNVTAVAVPSGVTDIADNAFAGCDWLTSVSIPSSVTHIGENAFSGCTGLGDGVVIADGCVLTVNGGHEPDVEIPEGTRLIADGAFAGDEHLKTILIPSTVESLTATFYGCESLESVTLSEGVKTLASVRDGDRTSSDDWRGTFGACESLLSVIIPRSLETVGEFAFFTFGGCADDCAFFVGKGESPRVRALLKTSDPQREYRVIEPKDVPLELLIAFLRAKFTPKS